jgi:hypothetical protein
VAAGVAAPTLVGYVLWVLQQARQHKLRRLYFLSREGEILLSIARTLATKLDIDCELVYLYASRQAWHLPSITKIDDSIREWLFANHGSLSIAQILRRVCLTPEVVQSSLEQLGFSVAQSSEPLSEEDHRRLERLLEDPVFQAALLDSAARKREVAVEYFRQKGIFEPIRWGVVDVGWAGMIQRSLARILAVSGRGELPIGFYYGLYKGGTDPAGGIWETYMFDHRSNTGFGPWSGIVACPLIDIFCEGTEGQVLEYDIKPDGTAEPVLKEKMNQPALDWGLPVVRSAILQFVDSLPLTTSLIDAGTDLRAATAEVLGVFWYSPTRREGETWGAFPYDKEQGGGPVRALAQQACSWKDVVRIGLGGTLPQSRVGMWWPGSLAISSPAARKALKLAKRARKRVLKLSKRLSLIQS